MLLDGAQLRGGEAPSAGTVRTKNETLLLEVPETGFSQIQTHRMCPLKGVAEGEGGLLALHSEVISLSETIRGQVCL